MLQRTYAALLNAGMKTWEGRVLDSGSPLYRKDGSLPQLGDTILFSCGEWWLEYEIKNTTESCCSAWEMLGTNEHWKKYLPTVKTKTEAARVYERLYPGTHRWFGLEMGRRVGRGPAYAICG